MRSDRLAHAFVFTFLLWAGCACAQEHVCLRDACYSVEVARTDEARSQGLMFRPGLGQGKGMFFIFDDEEVYPFWMKNTLFAIDIIWLGRDKRVVYIASDAQPCTAEPCPLYTPSASAMYVLEIPAGDVNRYGIQPGDLLR